MNRKHQNEAIAKRLGWVETGQCHWLDARKNFHRFPDDYVNELKPVFQAVQHFPKQVQEKYLQILTKITKAKSANGDFRLAQATSAQRAEALVKALNEWVDGGYE